jgi:hypothetical protein
VQNLLGVWPEGITASYLTPDGRHVAYCVPDNEKVRMVVDGQIHPPAHQITDVSAFSPDGRHFAYVTREGVVFDGDLTLEPLAEQAIFSPDSNHLALLLANRISIDDKLGDIYAKVEKFTFSANSAHFAYVAHRIIKDEDVKFVVHDGEPSSEPFDHIGFVAISPDGKHVAYSGTRTDSATATRTNYLVVDQKITVVPNEIIHAQFSPDSKRLATSEGWDGDAYLDGKKLPQCKIARHANFIFSPDSSYVICIGNKTAVGDKLYRTASDQFVFSPDGKRLAFFGGDPADTRPLALVIDGKMTANFGECQPNSIRFSSDSKKIAYIVRANEKARVILDHIPGPEFDAIPYAPVFNSEGKLCYTARTGNDIFHVIDGKISRQFTVIPPDPFDAFAPYPFLTPDGKHIGWFEINPLQKHRVRAVVNGEPGPYFAKVEKYAGKTPQFGADGILEYIAIDDQRIYRVKHIP